MTIDPIKSLFLKGLDDESARVDSKDGIKPAASELAKDNIKSFSLSGRGHLQSELVQDKLPSPIQLAAQHQDRKMSSEDCRLDEEKMSQELRESIDKLKNELGDFRLQVQNSYKTEQADKERYDAMTLVMGLINEDLDVVAKETGQDLKGKQGEEEEPKSVIRRVVDWVSTGEEVLNRAMIYLSGKQGEPASITDFLKLQYAVQRATQRAELFASIVGTSVSSIKTIMTTQLG